MLQQTAFNGSAINPAWAQQRMRNELLLENTQMEGTSDTHPFLSPNDEWADFEIYPYRIASRLRSKPQGSYVRGLAERTESGRVRARQPVPF